MIDCTRVFTMAALLSTILFTGCQNGRLDKETEQWGVFEIALPGPNEGNPYMDVELTASFLSQGTSINVPGFYDGDGRYYVRFSPPHTGTWSYETTSNVEILSGKRGKFRCVEPTGRNHGPVEVVDTFYLQYADDTPFYAVGTTAYQWTSVKQSIQAQTLKTLESAPFNKVRMCFFPKWYRYGNDTEPWTYPFVRIGEENDLTRPDYTFFRNFDQRVRQLMDLGIQADIILFHPYDHWGYSTMGDEMNKRYVRYMIARLSAFRNVWWSLANEWDVPSIKEGIDWEGIGTLLEREDPHQRPRGIHNWYNTEDHFYDHTRPWLTHVSAQTSQFQNAILWMNRYKKPLLFDEMRYEGDVPSGWGNLSGEEMTSYFWMAGLSGGYGTHGETYRNPADDSTEVRWWAKGGILVGESPERIRFFRGIMEETPVHEMAPRLISNGDPAQVESNFYLLAKDGEYYLGYVADTAITVQLELPGKEKYQVEVIDTWNMKITDQFQLEAGVFNYQPAFPYTAFRIRRVQ